VAIVMKKWVIISLAVIFFVAIFMRLLPLTQYAVWGSDTGEYYYLTNKLSENGHISTQYNGWGFGYPYFPGMFYLAGSLSFLLGVDNLKAMSRLG
jgi:4-amino-4-deoxy-L-arabinose transferase-like glycosyltransferase